MYVAGAAVLCAAAYVLFGPDRLWKKRGESRFSSSLFSALTDRWIEQLIVLG